MAELLMWFDAAGGLLASWPGKDFGWWETGGSEHGRVSRRWRLGFLDLGTQCLGTGLRCAALPALEGLGAGGTQRVSRRGLGDRTVSTRSFGLTCEAGSCLIGGAAKCGVTWRFRATCST